MRIYNAMQIYEYVRMMRIKKAIRMMRISNTYSWHSHEDSQHSHRLLGQSLVEVVVALAIFLILVGSGVVTVLGALSTSRLGEEETQATVLATEGIEAVDSIRNQGWDNLVQGTYGLISTSGRWEFSGTSDVDASGKFTRVINVTQVERDANGDIVASGGTVDNDTFKVTSTVSWYFTPARPNQVSLVSYVTNWQEGVGAAATPTPPATNTPTPAMTSTPTPTIAPPPASCAEYCPSINASYTTGTCRKKPPDCAANGEVYESGGDVFCSGANNKCCCS